MGAKLKSIFGWRHDFTSWKTVEGLGATFIDTCSSTSSQVLLYQVFVLQQQELGSAIIIKVWAFDKLKKLIEGFLWTFNCWLIFHVSKWILKVILKEMVFFFNNFVFKNLINIILFYFFFCRSDYYFFVERWILGDQDVLSSFL